jgi:uncharacterized protein with ATP-grasp and redox domains
MTSQALTAALDALALYAARQHPKEAEARLEVERLIGELERERDVHGEAYQRMQERAQQLADERDSLRADNARLREAGEALLKAHAIAPSGIGVQLADLRAALALGERQQEGK